MTIIGVIAALTIPNLMVKHEKQVTATKLKKVYSTLSEACAKIELDDPDFFDSIPSAYDEKVWYALDQKLRQHLKVAVKCNYILGENMHSKECTGGNTLYDFRNYPRIVLEDGTIIIASNQGYTCGFAPNIVVDINGFKGPNISGKDIFVFQYNVRPPYPRRLIPKIPQGSGTYCNGPTYLSREFLKNTPDGSGCSKNGSGAMCAALIMKDGWQILDDYPW